MKEPSPASARSTAEAIEATAAAWLAERDAGLSAEDAVRFSTWCAEDPRHAAAVARLEAAWEALLPLREFRPTAQRHPDADLLQPRPRPWSRVWPILLVSGALAAGLAVMAIWPAHPVPAPLPAAESSAHYVTTVGGYQRVTLPDQSVAELNANTEIREQFTPAERHLVLVRGEATFQVAKNPARPFVVEASGVRICAVGTAFNVRLQAAQVDVLVTEGRVRIEAPTVDAALPTVGRGERLVVPTNASVSSPSRALAVVPVPTERISEELSWREPRLVFLETPLAEVVREFNARNHVQIELADPELATLPVGGSFRADNVEAFVRLLVSSGQIQVETVEGDRLRLRRIP